jgi:ribosomal protein S18 acetylase RimI-like enzyme
MPAEPAIATFRPDDEAAVVALWQRCGLVVPWNDPAADIALALGSGHGHLLVARDGATVVGAALVGHDGHRGWIYYLAVAPERRLAGLGSRLVSACEAWVAARGVPKIQLMIRRTSAAVRAFYGTQGYEDSDVVVMQRWLLPKANER